jgi:methionyl-tRNA formyltransferase
MNMKVDLFLDGDLGLWALNQVQKEQVGIVFTTDNDLFDNADKKDFVVLLDDPNHLQFISSQRAISIHYKRILNRSVLGQYEKTFNLHPSYLPWGRGYYPIFWALWENTPAGATLHEMMEQVDQGPIVEQINVEYETYETGYDLFLRIREAEKKLFLKFFPKIASGDLIVSYAQSEEGTYHTKKDFFSLKEDIDWKSLSADSFIKLVRYLTFPGFPGFSIELGGQCYEIFLDAIETS